MPEGEQPEILASDAERSQTLVVLRGAAADGRLNLEEFSQRVQRALIGRTRADLEQVTQDLPSVPVAAPTASRPPARWSVAIMSGSEREGRWRVGEEYWAVAIMGGCKIDLRQAVISSPVITINAIAIMGGVEIYVPEGVEVELGGVAIMAGKDASLSGPPPPPGAPVVRVNAFAFWSGVQVRDSPTLGDRVREAVADRLDERREQRRELREERRRRRRELRGR